MAERIAQHEMSEADRRCPGRERGRDRPALERVDVRRHRRREVVHQPHRIETGRLGRERAFEHPIETHAELREIEAEPGERHAGRTLASASDGTPEREHRRVRFARGHRDGVVFDFDGLILDTEGPVFTAWQEAFEAYGCPPLTIEEWAAEIGTAGGLDLVGIIRSRATRPFDEEAMHARRRARRDELLEQEVVRPGVAEWLDEADALGLALAIASSSPRDWVESASRTARSVGPVRVHLLLRRRRRRRQTGTRSLPRRVPRRSECDRRSALAIEDSPHGIAAAKAAGMWCVAVPHGITEGLDLSHADVRLRSLADASLRDVISSLS